MTRREPKSEPGGRLTSAQVITLSTAWSFAMIAAGAFWACVILAALGHRFAVPSVLTGAGLAALIVGITWLVERLVMRWLRRFQAVSFVFAFLLKLALLMWVMLGLWSKSWFIPRVFGVSFFIGIIVFLVVASIVVLTAHGPDLNDE